MSLGSSVHDAYARLADALNQSDEAQAIARKLRIPPPLLPAIVMGTSLVVIVVLVLDFYASVLAGFLCWIYPTLATMRLLLKHIDYEKEKKKNKRQRRSFSSTARHRGNAALASLLDHICHVRVCIRPTHRTMATSDDSTLPARSHSAFLQSRNQANSPAEKIDGLWIANQARALQGCARDHSWHSKEESTTFLSTAEFNPTTSSSTTTTNLMDDAEVVRRGGGSPPPEEKKEEKMSDAAANLVANVLDDVLRAAASAGTDNNDEEKKD
eukprot:CAMPEP_0119194194 /NCGR_PEP_ID=MMETSP1316-20130426/4076_1 /TAXON_ID=41880 /ORGANISM="Pycnococcus provasolii, Strain RCC2336" /LENGTH=268 /DNA_ID=CAMNT_0007189507 /DNA_START=30 /DNA_END=837 /DNA_ORIENTATION=+